RSEAISRPLVCHRKFDDVHAWLHSAGHDIAASALHPNDVGLYGGKSRPGFDAGWIGNSVEHARSWIHALQVRSAQNNGFRINHAYRRALLHEPFQSVH